MGARQVRDAYLVGLDLHRKGKLVSGSLCALLIV
jgi:hypothetical protein